MSDEETAFAVIEEFPEPALSNALNETTAERIKRLRAAAGLTQAALAVTVGRSGSWLEKVETGRVAVDKVSTLASLAAALGVSPLALIATRLRDLRRG